MNYLGSCNTLQNFSEPTYYIDKNCIRIDFEKIYDEDGNEITDIFIKYNPSSGADPNPDYKYEKYLMVVEKYRKSIFAREYGAGKTLHTHTLLPGERCEMHVNTTTVATSTTSSILDSFDAVSEAEYKAEVERQETSQESAKELQEINAHVSAKGSAGFGSAKGSANFNSTIQASREAFGEKMSSALSTHASTQSAKRIIQVNTSKQEVTTANTSSVRREFQNLNTNRTLNFVFRQLNQSFVCIRHLIDVEIAIVEKSYDEAGTLNYYTYDAYPLTKLNNVLEKHINEKAREKIEKIILAQLHIIDYKGEKHKLYDTKEYGNEKYHRFIRCYSTYDKNDMSPCQEKVASIDEGNCSEPIIVPGYILCVQEEIMKTNGVVVDALLGRNNALEPHLLRMQEQEYIAKALEHKSVEVDDKFKEHLLRMREEEYEEECLENEEYKLLIEREKLAQKIVSDAEHDGCMCNQADCYHTVFCCDSFHDCNEHELND